MMPLSPATRIYLASGATDLRRSFEGLGDLVTHQFKPDPLSGNLFVFTNRRKNRIKLLYFDGTGVWVCAKRLMGQGCFAWPNTTEPGALRIAAGELALLLSGLDAAQTQARPWWRQAA
jgi:transposase